MAGLILIERDDVEKFLQDHREKLTGGFVRTMPEMALSGPLPLIDFLDHVRTRSVFGIDIIVYGAAAGGGDQRITDLETLRLLQMATDRHDD